MSEFMPERRGARTLLALAIIFILCLSPAALAVQKENKKKNETPAGTPVLWREPADISSRDLFLGPGGEKLWRAANEQASRKKCGKANPVAGFAYGLSR